MLAAAVFARIVVCVDARPPGLKALRAAFETAAQFGASLAIVTVLPPAGPDGSSALERLIPVDPEGRSIHHLMEDAQDEAMRRGIAKTELVYLRGTAPAEAILAYLRPAPPDLVVVGTRGLSRGSRFLLGSVSSRLVTEAPCPVMVVRDVKRARKA